MLIKLTHAHILGTIIAYLIGVCLVPMVISFSKKEGLVDMPNARKIHTHPISRIGGVAIWTSTMLTFLCLVFMSYYPSGNLLSGILLGGSLMFLLGLVDDIYNLDAKFKLFLQVAIATLVYLLGVQINNVPFIGDIGIFSYPITMLWIVGISNAFNFIDGVDGLAGSVVTVNAVTLAIIAVAMTPPNPISALILGVPIYFIACTLEKGGKYKIYLKKFEKTGTRKEKLDALKCEYVKFLEDLTKQYPLQFYHFYDFLR